MALPTTPVKKLIIAAKVRATRKGQRMDAPVTGKLGGKGLNGVHFYDIVVAPAGQGAEKLQCSCPAHRYRRAKLVQATGFCKHIHKVVQEMAVRPGVTRTENADVIVYAPEAITALTRGIQNAA